MSSTLQAIKWDPIDKKLEILDQLQLPHRTAYVPVKTVEDAHSAIKDMVVRGAPAIAIVAVLALASELHHADPKPSSEKISEKLDYLITARPTAVNLSQGCNALRQLANGDVEHIIAAAEKYLEDDVLDNKNIGKHGSNWILDQVPKDEKISVLTICNTGSLATAGYGTALGVIRALHAAGRLEHAYCLETRPYNQGSRLTAYELVHDQIPATLICDSMASSLLRDHPEIKLVVVGADRVAANGDTANKIGTYQLSIVAKHHGVKFMVAAPTTTIDLNTKTGKDVVIEQRAAHELTQVKGPELVNGEIVPSSVKTVVTAASGINVWNPAFDVTTHDLVDAIATEKGVQVKEKGAFNLA